MSRIQVNLLHFISFNSVQLIYNSIPEEYNILFKDIEGLN